MRGEPDLPLLRPPGSSADDGGGARHAQGHEHHHHHHHHHGEGHGHQQEHEHEHEHDHAHGVLRCTTLRNGVRVLSRSLVERDVAALGVWLRNGYRDEAPGERGMAHLLEHLLLADLGDADPSLGHRELAAAGIAVNGECGAELTSIAAMVPGEQLWTASRFMVDRLLRPRIALADLARETAVIRAELDQWPQDPVRETLRERLWPRQDGDTDANALPPVTDAVRLEDYWRERVTGTHLAVVAVGAVDHDALVELASPLAALPPSPADAPSASARAARRLAWMESDVGATPGRLRQVAAFALPPPREPAFDTAVLLHTLLWSTPWSRTFRALRAVDRGYGFVSEPETWADGGIWWLELEGTVDGAATRRRLVEEALAAVADGDVGEAELAVARARLALALRVEDDDSWASMQRLGRELLLLGAARETRTRLAALAGVEATALASLAARLLDGRD